MIVHVSPSEVLDGCRQLLGLPQQRSGQPLDDVLLAGLLRRSAGIHCPCSRTTLRASLVESTRALSENADTLPARLDAAIEALIVGGDLLELNDVITDDSDVRGTWVFAAPPSFVLRPSGTAFLFGVVPDQDTFLPGSLAERVVYHGFTRMIAPTADEDLAGELREHGLQHVSESAWFKGPKHESASAMLDRFELRLRAQPVGTPPHELEVLDSTRPVTYYRGRWVSLTNQTGTFVGRRPQEFGAPIWCFVELQEGVPLRFLDLPLKATRWRACDTAWHLQMAIDYCRHRPQLYRRRLDTGGVRFDFLSPLPQWSRRRLMVFGDAVARDKSLFSSLVSQR